MSKQFTRFTPRRRTPRRKPSPVTSEAEREQALRDYKVTIEYKHLKQHAPGGVYLIPSLDDLRHFFGVIFVRRGPFTNGIFKFQIRLPERYNDTNAHPRITFSSYVYNPYVNAETGELDVRAAYPTWDPHKHYLVTVLTYLKKIFYMKHFGEDATANAEARQLARGNSQEYRKKVDNCVKESQRLVFVNDPGCTAKFTEDRVEHQILRGLIRLKIEESMTTMNRGMIMDIVKEARLGGEEATDGKEGKKGNEAGGASPRS
eukprot:CAMPEP_0172504754 /NCGR_PEP_ID=MMETSP1066-20121228/181001_1 /TAXON_ID=671091 /ORGANISM="Coscinodiscus wailesii, Strain CCMP2513" /LENGTH=259 /DNA_ID=CAMNT_0013281053 /DNA_START=128 /DNA_END=907 /DNA_ORIENTATION=-